MEEINKNMEIQKKITELPITVPKPRPQIHHQQQQQQQKISHNSNCIVSKSVPGTSKYAELLHVIEDLGQHIRPSYTGHRGSAEKIKQGIIKARVLVRECLVETEKSARQ